VRVPAIFPDRRSGNTGYAVRTGESLSFEGGAAGGIKLRIENESGAADAGGGLSLSLDSNGWRSGLPWLKVRSGTLSLRSRDGAETKERVHLLQYDEAARPQSSRLTTWSEAEREGEAWNVYLLGPRFEKFASERPVTSLAVESKKKSPRKIRMQDCDPVKGFCVTVGDSANAAPKVVLPTRRRIEAVPAVLDSETVIVGRILTPSGTKSAPQFSFVAFEKPGA
jgi:hypothetical protein